MSILFGFLFVLLALIPFYFSEDKALGIKRVPLRLGAVIFGIIGFRRIIAFTKTANIPETISPNIMYALIVVIFGIGPEILSLLGNGLEFFMERTFWKTRPIQTPDDK